MPGSRIATILIIGLRTHRKLLAIWIDSFAAMATVLAVGALNTKSAL